MSLYGVAMVEIALFPIPSCVAFPHTLFPLHVFEPRYRGMIKHCIEHEMLLGICHTQKVLRRAKDGQSLQEALNSNQATYKPYDIFSAGWCELLETMDDGRMRISVHVEDRFTLKQEIQTLPFSIYRCEAIPDDESSAEEEKQAELCKQKILKRLIAITRNIPEVQRLLASEKWQRKPAAVFSFELFGLMRLAPDIQQSILELRKPYQRLEKVLTLLNSSQ